MGFGTAAAALSSLALGAVQASATETAALDLICNGQRGERIHLRLDLAQRQWCVSPCRSVGPIYQLTDSTIKLIGSSSDRSDVWTLEIDRYTSTFIAIRRGYGDDPADRGSCTATPFSGFPSRRF